MEIRDNRGKFSFPGGTRDRRSKSGTVPGVSGRLAPMPSQASLPHYINLRSYPVWFSNQQTESFGVPQLWRSYWCHHYHIGCLFLNSCQDSSYHVLWSTGITPTAPSNLAGRCQLLFLVIWLPAEEPWNLECQVTHKKNCCRCEGNDLKSCKVWLVQDPVWVVLHLPWLWDSNCVVSQQYW